MHVNSLAPPNFTTGFSEIHRPDYQVKAPLLDIIECNIKEILNTCRRKTYKCMHFCTLKLFISKVDFAVQKSPKMATCIHFSVYKKNKTKQKTWECFMPYLFHIA